MQGVTTNGEALMVVQTLIRELAGGPPPSNWAVSLSECGTLGESWNPIHLPAGSVANGATLHEIPGTSRIGTGYLLRYTWAAADRGHRRCSLGVLCSTIPISARVIYNFNRPCIGVQLAVPVAGRSRSRWVFAIHATSGNGGVDSLGLIAGVNAFCAGREGQNVPWCVGGDFNYNMLGQHPAAFHPATFRLFPPALQNALRPDALATLAVLPLFHQHVIYRGVLNRLASLQHAFPLAALNALAALQNPLQTVPLHAFPPPVLSLLPPTLQNAPLHAFSPAVLSALIALAALPPNTLKVLRSGRATRPSSNAELDYFIVGGGWPLPPEPFPFLFPAVSIPNNGWSDHNKIYIIERYN